ncbi:MAG: hypothetical protein NTZ51_10510 [Proteobacteria bacterium]|nr:hypothetical protein [Pseudomonadota bacterium]
MSENYSRRNFLKYFLSILSFSIPTFFSFRKNEPFKVGKLKIRTFNTAEAAGECGGASDCAGGGSPGGWGDCGATYECPGSGSPGGWGECGANYDCSGTGSAGGEGGCGASYTCTGGGGQCGASHNCGGTY